MSKYTDDKLESNYKGSALLHLLSYMKPYVGWVALCLVLVLALTGFDLYRPILIGDAIDNFEKQGNFDVIVETAVKYGIVLVLSLVFNIVSLCLAGFTFRSKTFSVSFFAFIFKSFSFTRKHLLHKNRAGRKILPA